MITSIPARRTISTSCPAPRRHSSTTTARSWKTTISPLRSESCIMTIAISWPTSAGTNTGECRPSGTHWLCD
ncbi:hypothetical protein BIW11_08817 [Tropilaelaps mercedesae]|uniref:Uncharacterized protein n=1 Tax=Tropilaelaps mercedesae TaxID=418985 RepID=A0A1V9XMU5_9ACAR|nr:hypothetical protein BIW11_08817 [Tropilaelaps mercedesae]